MKISKQLLKEIIIQEYNMVLLESAITDDLMPIVKKFVDKYKSVKLGQEEKDMVVHAAVAMNNMLSLLQKYMNRQLKKDVYDRAQERVLRNLQKLEEGNSYSRLLADMVREMRKFLEVVTTEGSDNKAANSALSNVTRYANLAIRNMDNIKAYTKIKDIQTADTKAFAME